MKLILMSLFAITVCAQAKELTLNQYLELVKGKDPSYKAAELSLSGAQKVENNSNLLTGVNFIAGASYLNDGRPTISQAFQGDKTINNSYSLGLQQQTQFGLTWALSQNFSYTKINNATIVPLPEYYDAYPKLELSMPLWRNWMGEETKSSQESLRNQLQVQKLNSELQQIQKINDVKDAFYNLMTQQKNFEIQQDSLARAEKILGWAQSRVNRNLSDKSDLFQTQALVSVRKIDLINAQNKLNEAKRQFNYYLGHEGTELQYFLIGSDVDLKMLQVNTQKIKSRIDLLLQKENLKSSESSYQAQKEKNKPNLNLNLALSRTGRDASQSVAQTKMTSENKDYLLVSLNFSMPLDVGNLSDSREGYEMLAQSQRLSEQAREKTERLSWQNVMDQASALDKQLKIVKDLESIQKSKADLERSKYNNGRSTAYQVLSFEQDYVNSRNQRINLEYQIQKFINSLDLYK